jgi:S1-C subfamily serine protease
LILRTVPGGAADRAGLRGGRERAYLGNSEIFLGGDLIIGMDDQPVTSPQDLGEIMNRHEVGDAVVVTFLRGQRKLTAKVVLGDAAASSGSQS